MVELDRPARMKGNRSGDMDKTGYPLRFHWALGASSWNLIKGEFLRHENRTSGGKFGAGLLTT